MSLSLLAFTSFFRAIEVLILLLIQRLIVVEWMELVLAKTRRNWVVLTGFLAANKHWIDNW